MANLSRYCERIQESLLRYCDSLKVDSRGNLQNEALYAEYVFRDVINLAFGWNLKNANEDDVLTAGFDLVDPEERILIQVTKDSSRAKIEHSFETLESTAYQGYRFLFMLLVSNHPKYTRSFESPQGIVFDPAQDILDIAQLMKRIRALPIAKVHEVYECVEQHLESTLDARNIPTSLGKVLMALAPHDMVSGKKLDKTVAFMISDKISVNKLGAYHRRISRAATFSHLVVQLYGAYAAAGTYEGETILVSLADDYDVLAAREDDSLAIFDGLVDVLMDRLERDASVADVTYEMRRFCVTIVLVDAFMRCRIFRGPNVFDGGGVPDDCLRRCEA